MSRKVVLALLLIMALVVTACAPATAPGAAPAAPAAGEEATATKAPAGEVAAAPSGDAVTLTIESWRNDDLSIWQDTIIPAF
jgi:raffinose/stachyose/melibiose transport system substrate-binding protein